MKKIFIINRDYKKLASAPTDFSKNIKQARLDAGLTGKRVAQLLGKSSHSCIYNWESGLALPTLIDFVRLCEIYKTTPNAILEFKQPSQ